MKKPKATTKATKRVDPTLEWLRLLDEIRGRLQDAGPDARAHAYRILLAPFLNREGRDADMLEQVVPLSALAAVLRPDQIADITHIAQTERLVELQNRNRYDKQLMLNYLESVESDPSNPGDVETQTVWMLYACAAVMNNRHCPEKLQEAIYQGLIASGLYVPELRDCIEASAPAMGFIRKHLMSDIRKFDPHCATNDKAAELPEIGSRTP